MNPLSAYVGEAYQPPRGCWELVRQVYREQLSIDLPAFEDEAGPLTGAEREELAAVITRHKTTWRQVSSPQRFDLVLIRIAGQPMHLGIVTEPGFFLHVQSGQTARIEPYRAAKWRPRLEGFYRYAA